MKICTRHSDHIVYDCMCCPACDDIEKLEEEQNKVVKELEDKIAELNTELDTLN